MYVDRWGQTDPGKQRLDNQDSIYFAQAGKQGTTQAQINAHGVLLAVADGVGGGPGGQEASQAIIRHLVAAYYNTPKVDPVSNLRQAIQLADRLARQEATYREAATTLVAAIIWRNQLVVANIGDSRAYWIRGEQIHQLTEDHVQDGKLARYLVSYPNVQPDLAQLPDLEPGDRILLCSDGLYDPVPEADQIRALAARGGAKQAAKRLVKTANQYGGPDNVSVVMARLTKQPPMAVWQIGVIAGLILLLFVVGGIFVSIMRAEPIPPSLTETPALATTETPTPDDKMTFTSTTTSTDASLGPQTTVTLYPSPTSTLTPSITPVAPTPTNTFTPVPTSMPTLTPMPPTSTAIPDSPPSEEPPPTGTNTPPTPTPAIATPEI